MTNRQDAAKQSASSPLSDKTKAALAAKAVLIDRYAIRSTSAAASGHPSTATSLGHIVAVLMYHQMRWDPADPWSLANDRLVLSEGHAVPIVYPAYADLGGRVGADRSSSRRLTLDDVLTLRQNDSILDGHPNPALGVPFFDAATGSLGMGASVAAGLGFAARLDNAAAPRRVYAIIGDGESREGQIWEAVDAIAEQGLDNVTLIFNANGQGQSDPVAPQQSADALAAKLAAAGFDVVAIDGHDVDAIYSAVSRPRAAGRPLAVVARTVKGWGSSELQSGNWHGKPLPAASVERAMADLDARLAECGLPDPTKVSVAPGKPAKAVARPKSPAVSLGEADFEGLLANHPLESARKLLGGVQKGKLATRRAYGLALAELGRRCDRIVALDGDVKNSTFAEFFAQMFPDRYVECRIGEQNMVSMAAGLAAGGKIPFASTFGKFLSRAFDQVELAVISNANVKLCGSHSGVTLGADGPSQMSVTDVAFFSSFGQRNVPLGERTTPGWASVRPADAACPVLIPADAVCAWRLVELMANHVGPCYLRTLRPDTPLLYKPNEKFPLGGHKVVRKGKHLVIAAAGYMVHEALRAADRLAERRIQATVLDCYCLPLNAGPILTRAAANGKALLTVEDHYAGGLGAALAVAAAETAKVRVKTMAVRRIPKSGDTPEDMLKMCGLDAAAIVRQGRKLIGK